METQTNPRSDYRLDAEAFHADALRAADLNPGAVIPVSGNALLQVKSGNTLSLTVREFLAICGAYNLNPCAYIQKANWTRVTE